MNEKTPEQIAAEKVIGKSLFVRRHNLHAGGKFYSAKANLDGTVTLALILPETGGTISLEDFQKYFEAV